MILFVVSLSMNRKNRVTLEAIFTSPVPQDIRFSDIMALIVALGGDVDKAREGSRVGFQLNGVRAVFHKPYPRPQTNRNTVRDVREFLIRAGVKP
jgi:hypothetical protein